MARLLTTLRQWLLEPSAAIAPRHRTQAALLSGMVLVMLIAGSCGLPFAKDDTVYTLTTMVVLLALSYTASRTKHYIPAAILALAAWSSQPFLRLIWISHDIRDIAMSLSVFSWLALGLCVSSILFSTRGVIAMALIDVVAIVALGIVAGRLSGGAAAIPLIFIISVAALLTVDAALRARQARDVRASEERFRSLFNATIEGKRVGRWDCHRPPVVA